MNDLVHKYAANIKLTVQVWTPCGPLWPPVAPYASS